MYIIFKENIGENVNINFEAWKVLRFSVTSNSCYFKRGIVDTDIKIKNKFISIQKDVFRFRATLGGGGICLTKSGKSEVLKKNYIKWWIF